MSTAKQLKKGSKTYIKNKFKNSNLFHITMGQWLDRNLYVPPITLDI